MAEWISGFYFGIAVSIVVFYSMKHMPKSWIAAMKRMFVIRVIANEIWR